MSGSLRKGARTRHLLCEVLDATGNYNIGLQLVIPITHPSVAVPKEEISFRVHGDYGNVLAAPPLCTERSLRIPTKPAMHSNMKPATDSEVKPAGIPI